MRRQQLLAPFVKALDETPIGNLTHFKVESFLADMRRPHANGKSRHSTRNDSTVTSFLQTILAALSWAVNKNLITEDPLEGIRKPGIRSRGRDGVIPPAQHQTFLARCRSKEPTDVHK